MAVIGHHRWVHTSEVSRLKLWQELKYTCKHERLLTVKGVHIRFQSMLEAVDESQPRPQGLLLDDFQNGGSSGEDPGKGWVTWYKISKNLGDFYHVTF